MLLCSMLDIFFLRKGGGGAEKVWDYFSFESPPPNPPLSHLSPPFEDYRPSPLKKKKKMFSRRFDSYKRLDICFGKVRLVNFPSGSKRSSGSTTTAKAEELKSIVKLRNKDFVHSCLRSRRQGQGQNCFGSGLQGPSLRKWLKHLNPRVWPRGCRAARHPHGHGRFGKGPLRRLPTSGGRLG